MSRRQRAARKMLFSISLRCHMRLRNGSNSARIGSLRDTIRAWESLNKQPGMTADVLESAYLGFAHISM